jgi:serine/threonine protein kinase
LVRKLGSGGFASVWEAIELATARRVALKLLDLRLGALERAAQYFRREGEVLAALKHPNLAQAFEVGVEGGQPYLVIELVEGRSLEKLIAERASLDRSFSLHEVISLFEQLAGAVEHAHAHGVLHRDLKPANVLVAAGSGARAKLKVIDFGLAKMIEESGGSEGTTRGRRLGSLAYMAPEQARGDPVGTTADVFALGVMLFELLTLRRPFLRDDHGELLRAYADPVRLNKYNNPAVLVERMASEARPETGRDPRVDQVVRKALASDPHDRYASVAAFAEAVRELAALEKPKLRFSPAPWVGSVVLALIAGVLIAYLREEKPVVRAVIAEPQPPPPLIETRPIVAAAGVVETSTRAELPPPPPATKRKDPPPRSAPARVAAELERSPLLEELAKLEQNTAPTTTWIALGEKITARAEQLKDTKLRARVQRLAKSSAALGDAAGLERAIAELERGLSAEEPGP